MRTVAAAALAALLSMTASAQSVDPAFGVPSESAFALTVPAPVAYNAIELNWVGSGTPAVVLHMDGTLDADWAAVDAAVTKAGPPVLGEGEAIILLRLVVALRDACGHGRCVAPQDGGE